MYWGCSHYCGDVRFTISPQQLLSVLSTAVGCFCGFVLKWCHCTAPRHLGGGLSKLSLLSVTSLQCADIQVLTHAHTTRQTRRYVTTKPWHGTCPKEIPLWRKREGAAMGAVVKRSGFREREREKERSKISNSSVCLCTSVIGWEEHQKKAGELQAVRAEGIDWLVILKPYLLHQPYKQMHMSVS